MRYFVLHLLLIAVIVSFCSNTSGQTSIGTYGGLTSMNLAGDRIGLAVYRPHIGWNAGAVVNISLTDDVFFSLEPGVSFNMLRVQAADTLQLKFRTKLVYEDSVKLNLSTFNLPLLIKVVTDKRRFQFTSGIELSYLFSARWNNGEEKIDVRSEVDNFNVSAIFGIGYIIPVGSTHLKVDARYLQGLINLSDSSTDQSVLPRIKTKGFRINLEWTLPIDKSQTM